MTGQGRAALARSPSVVASLPVSLAIAFWVLPGDADDLNTKAAALAALTALLGVPVAVWTFVLGGNGWRPFAVRIFGALAMWLLLLGWLTATRDPVPESAADPTGAFQRAAFVFLVLAALSRVGCLALARAAGRHDRELPG